MKDNCYDILLINDERDIITEHVNNVKREFENVLPKPTVRAISIYDYNNEKEVIKCDKAVFCICEETNSIEFKVPVWLKLLNNNKGVRPEDSLIVYLSNTKPEQLSDTYIIDQISYNVKQVQNLDDTLLWWPCVLKLVFGELKRRKKCSVFLNMCEGVDTTDIEINKSQSVHNQLTNICKDFGIPVTTKSSDDPTRIELLVGSTCTSFDSQAERLRERKINGNITIIFLTACATIYDNIRKCTTYQLCPNEFMRGVLYILDLAGIIRIQSKKSEPFKNVSVCKFQSQTDNSATDLKISWTLKNENSLEDYESVNVQLRHSANLKWTEVRKNIPKNETETIIEHAEQHLGPPSRQALDYQIKLTAEDSTGRFCSPIVSKWINVKTIESSTIKDRCLLFSKTLKCILIGILIVLFVIIYLLHVLIVIIILACGVNDSKMINYLGSVCGTVCGFWLGGAGFIMFGTSLTGLSLNVAIPIYIGVVVYVLSFVPSLYIISKIFDM